MKRHKTKITFVCIAALILLSVLYGCGDGDASATVKEIRSMMKLQKPLQAESVSEGKYAYETLDEDTKLVYDEIVYAIQNRNEKVRIATNDVNVMEKAYLAVRYDYCNFFWLEKFSYVTYNRGDNIRAIDITPVFSMTQEEQAAVQEQIDAEADKMMRDFPAEGTDYEKALYIYEKLISDVDYVEESADNQNIISVFINHETICQGYAYATQYLFEKAGIPCTTVVGTAQGENHAWNLVQLDGEYYYMDTTWGNSQYIYRGADDSSEMQGAGQKYIDYDYFAATTAAIMETHQPDERIALPQCTATENDYYIHEGKYFDEWDPKAVGKLIKKEYESGEQQVRIKFSDMELYEQALQYFVEEYHLADYCDGIESVRYMENADNCVLFLQFPGNEG